MTPSRRASAWSRSTSRSCGRCPSPRTSSSAERAGVRLDLDVARRLGPRARPSATASASTRTRIVEDLSVGEQQRVEILKALARECRVLIMDEPTAVLVPQEVDVLFADAPAPRRARGSSIVFISHKLGEVRAICDRVSVLRRGRMSRAPSPAHTDERELARMMVGRPTFGVGRAEAARPRRTTGAAGRGLDRARARTGWTRCATSASMSQRRDPGRGRGLGQRPDRARRGAVRDAQADRRHRYSWASRAGRCHADAR